MTPLSKGLTRDLRKDKQTAQRLGGRSETRCVFNIIQILGNTFNLHLDFVYRVYSTSTEYM